MTHDLFLPVVCLAMLLCGSAFAIGYAIGWDAGHRYDRWHQRQRRKKSFHYAKPPTKIR